MRRKKAVVAILASLAGCIQSTDLMINNLIVNNIEVSAPEFLDARNQIARFGLSITNNSNVDFCFTGYDELGLLRFPQNASLTKIGTPIFNLSERNSQTADKEDTPKYFHEVLSIPSGKSNTTFATVDAHEYPIEMVRNGTGNEFLFDLGNQYRAAGSVAVYDCTQVPSDGFFEPIPLDDDPESWGNGFLGIVNIPYSEPFYFN